MKMIPLILLPTLFGSLVLGCNKADGPGSGRIPSPAVEPVKSITVTAGNTTVETYSFTYDESGRLATLVRKDALSGTDLLNLSCTYNGSSSMTISGKMDGKVGVSTINVSHSSSKVSWENDESGAWQYSTYIRKNGTAEYTETPVDFTSNAGYYKSSTTLCDSYSAEGRDIVSSEYGTVLKGKAIKDIFGTGKDGLNPVRLSSSASLTTTYKYSEHEDRQNFNAFLFNCSFPVWYAEGLPGCEHLVTDITVASGAVTLPQSQHLDYYFNSDGDIQTVVRTWTSEGKTILTLKYIFNYQ